MHRMLPLPVPGDKPKGLLRMITCFSVPSSRLCCPMIVLSSAVSIPKENFLSRWIELINLFWLLLVQPHCFVFRSAEYLHGCSNMPPFFLLMQSLFTCFGLTKNKTITLFQVNFFYGSWNRLNLPPTQIKPPCTVNLEKDAAKYFRDHYSSVEN